MAVPWLLRSVSHRLIWNVALVLDASKEKAKQGTLARFPGVGTPDALPAIGRDRLIERGPTESDTSYSERLASAFDTWRTAGNAHTLLRGLLAYFSPGALPIRVVSEMGEWHEINPSTGVVTRTRPTPVPQPTIVSISPTSGPTAGGTVITVTGTGFYGYFYSLAFVGGTATTNFTIVDDQHVTIVAPAHAAGLSHVVLNMLGGTASLLNAFTYTATGIAPTVLAVSKDVYDYSGGSIGNVTGTDFVAGAVVSVGGTPCATTFISSTQLNFTMPSKAKGTYAVRVTNPDTQWSELANATEAFNPTSITGCVWWLRADLGITLNGSTEVTTWLDQSGVGDATRNVTAPNADKPAWNASETDYNNKPTLGPFAKTGTANNTILKTAAAAWTPTYSTFTLGLIGHALNTSNRYFTFQDSTMYTALLNSGSAPTVYAAGAATTISAAGNLALSASLLMAAWNGASSKLFVNSTFTASGSGPLSADVLGQYQMELGAYPGLGAANYGVERLAEVFAWDHVLTSGEATRLRKYLNDRYAKSLTN